MELDVNLIPLIKLADLCAVWKGKANIEWNHYFLLKNQANQAIKARILSWDRPGSGFLFNNIVK